MKIGFRWGKKNDKSLGKDEEKKKEGARPMA
jgi:hypothetical protein